MTTPWARGACLAIAAAVAVVGFLVTAPLSFLCWSVAVGLGLWVVPIAPLQRVAVPTAITLLLTLSVFVQRSLPSIPVSAIPAGSSERAELQRTPDEPAIGLYEDASGDLRAEAQVDVATPTFLGCPDSVLVHVSYYLVNPGARASPSPTEVLFDVRGPGAPTQADYYPGGGAGPGDIYSQHLHLSRTSTTRVRPSTVLGWPELLPLSFRFRAKWITWRSVGTCVVRLPRLLGFPPVQFTAIPTFGLGGGGPVQVARSRVETGALILREQSSPPPAVGDNAWTCSVQADQECDAAIVVAAPWWQSFRDVALILIGAGISLILERLTRPRLRSHPGSE